MSTWWTSKKSEGNKPNPMVVKEELHQTLTEKEQRQISQNSIEKKGVDKKLSQKLTMVLMAKVFGGL